MEAIGSWCCDRKGFLGKGDHQPAITDIKTNAERQTYSVSEVPQEKLGLASKNHQGVIALLSPIEYQDFEERVEIE